MILTTAMVLDVVVLGVLLVVKASRGMTVIYAYIVGIALIFHGRE